MNNTLEIGPFTYKIVIKDEILSSDGKQLLGSVEYDSGTIELRKSQSKDSFMTTLWHEIVHIILLQYGIDQNNKVKIEREKLVDTISYGIYEVIKRNPWIAGK